MRARSRVIGRGIPRRESGAKMFDLTINGEAQALVELVHAFAQRELRAGASGLSLVIARRSDTGTLGAFALIGEPDGLRVTRDDRALGRIGLGCAPTVAVALDGVALPSDARLAGGDELALARAIAWI